jgi:hypothetical protein
MLFWIGTLVVIVIFYIVFFYPWNAQKQTTIKGPFKLQEGKEVADTKSSQIILSNGNTGTFQAFVYPVMFQRTGQLSLCSDGSTPQPGEPDCNSGRFGICACDKTDCSRCKHVGYVNLINISNVVRLEILNAPDASRRNAALVQLVVRTLRNNATTNDTEVVEETIALPMIPLQKWTMITISREGRRYDIYYNASLVSSKRTEHVLDVGSAVGPILVGDKNMQGSIAYVDISDARSSASQVAYNYSRLADTTGQPYIMKGDIRLTDYIPVCDGGACLKGPSVRPSSPLMDWDTQYA